MLSSTLPLRLVTTTLATVALFTTATLACSLPGGAVLLDDETLVRDASILVSAVYSAETDLTPPRFPQRRIQVDAELRLTNVFRCGFASCCLPQLATARDVWLKGCADLRRSFVLGREYVILLSDAGDGTYRVGNVGTFTYLQRWFFDADSATLRWVRNSTCATARCAAARNSLCQPEGTRMPDQRSSIASTGVAQPRAEVDNVQLIDDPPATVDEGDDDDDGGGASTADVSADEVDSE